MRSTDRRCVRLTGNLLGSLAEAEAEEEKLAASVGIHVRGDSVFRDAKLRDEMDDSRFHWHRCDCILGVHVVIKTIFN